MHTEYKAEIRKIRLILAPHKTIKRTIKKSRLKHVLFCAISFIVGPFKCRTPNIDTPPKGQKQAVNPINDDPT